MNEPGRGLCYGMPVIVYGGLIFALSSFSELPEAIPSFSEWDGLLHFVEYYGLGWLLMRWLLSKRGRFWRERSRLVAVLGGVLYGLTDEWHQSFVPGREATLVDVFFDGLGVAAAAFSYRSMRRWFPFLDRLDEEIERRLAP